MAQTRVSLWITFWRQFLGDPNHRSDQPQIVKFSAASWAQEDDDCVSLFPSSFLDYPCPPTFTLVLDAKKFVAADDGLVNIFFGRPVSF